MQTLQTLQGHAQALAYGCAIHQTLLTIRKSCSRLRAGGLYCLHRLQGFSPVFTRLRVNEPDESPGSATSAATLRDHFDSSQAAQ